jgi:hypothetical protein
MGQAPFQHPTPDGYPDEAAPWLGTLLWRWNFALAVAANQVPSVAIDARRLMDAIGVDSPARALPHFVGRAGTEVELKALGAGAAGPGSSPDDRRAETLGLILASPAFQRY